MEIGFWGIRGFSEIFGNLALVCGSLFFKMLRSKAKLFRHIFILVVCLQGKRP